MYCRWCGMDSRTEDRCEWCHRVLTDREKQPLDERDRRAPWDVRPKDPLARSGDADLKPMGQQPEGQAFDALTKSRGPAAPLPEEPPAVEAAVEPARPAAPAETHPTAAAPEERQAAEGPDRMVTDARRAMTLPRTFGYRLEKFLGLAGAVTAVAMCASRLAPDLWWPIGAVTLFLCGMLMAVTRLGAAFEDDYVGLMALPAFTLMSGSLGPVVAPFAYVLVAIVVRRLNTTTMALGFVNLIVTGLLVAAYAGSSGSAYFGMGTFYDQSRMYIYFSFMLATLAGWVSSSLLLPVGEEA